MLDDENREILIEQTAKREKEKGEYYELSWKSKEGKDVHTMVSPAVILDPDGNFIGTSGVITDITDRKIAEEALRESEERYRAFTEEAIVGVYIYRGGKFYFVNKEMAAITGYSRGELLKISTDELVSPEDSEYLAEREKLRKKGDELPARYSLRIKRKDGEPAVLMVGSRPIQYGGETAYLGNCIDITENVKAQEALKSEKDKAQQYLDIAGVMLVFIGSDCNVRMINKKGCELLGCAEEDIIGKNWFTNFVPREVSADIKSRFEKLMAAGKEPEEYFENPVLTKNGEERIVLWHTTVLKDENGDIVGALSSGEDITERKLAEKASELGHLAFKIIAEAGIHASDVADLCQRVLTGLVGTLGFDAGTFRTYDEGENLLRLVASFGLKRTEKELSGVPQPIDDSRYVAAFVARSRQPIIAPDVSEEEVLGPFKSRLEEFKEQSLISWPVLSTGGNILGVLHLWSREHIDISVGDRAFFERMTGMFAAVLERKRTDEALRESEERIRQFAETVPDILYKFNQRECVYDFLSPAFEKMTGYSLSEIHADPCDFQLKLIHPDDTVRIMKIVNDYAAGGPKTEPLVIETRLVRADGEVIWVRDSMVYEWDDEGLSKVIGIMSDITERTRADEALSKSEREKSAILENMSEFVVYIDKEMRIIWANKAVADSLESAPDDLAGHKCYEMWFGRDRVCDGCHALTVFETGERVKTERKLPDGSIWNITYDPVRDDSGEIVGAVEVSSDITERKRAEAALQDTLTKLQKSLRGTVSTISKIVETRDPYTSGHQTRVAELARSMAEQMGLSSKRVELIYMAALVHDIGKISVPQEILSKPTELTELEWNIIRTHPEVGCEILKNVEFPWPVTDVVIQHHERLDGSGYPQGVAGDDIMLEARILSVADVVEAMSSHRPYRPELGMHKALEEVSDNKGILYDDEAVNVCVNLFKRDGFSFSQTL
jgi:PAS domain S-box-containing protein/putative nucleotidyltransferase with HDIG domain